MYLARQAFERTFNKSWQDMGMFLIYDVCHNIAKFEEHVIDGKKQMVCVHRKGATRAFGPNRKEVPVVYRKIGQPVLIPGSMGTSSWILVGTPTAMDITFGSTAHGAGRAMSRSAAIRMYRGSDVRRSWRIGE
jgi:tRNA-splicing ligase RtcB